jgi:hypothetical protein
MAWGSPKRNSKCRRCTSRGQCSCNRRVNAEIAANPAAGPTTCGQMCGWNGRGVACGRNVRTYCPCPNC